MIDRFEPDDRRGVEQLYRRTYGTEAADAICLRWDWARWPFDISFQCARPVRPTTLPIGDSSVTRCSAGDSDARSSADLGGARSGLRAQLTQICLNDSNPYEP